MEVLSGGSYPISKKGPMVAAACACCVRSLAFLSHELSLYVSACSNEKILSVAEVAELTVSRLS